MTKRDELIQSVKNALNKLEPLDRGWDLLSVVSYVTTIAVLEFESEIFSNTGSDRDIAYAIELDDIVEEYKQKLEDLWCD